MQLFIFLSLLIILSVQEDKDLSTKPAGYVDQETLKKWTKLNEALEFEDLKLSGKQITELNEDSLNGMFNLENIDLSHNRLVSLPSKIFWGLEKLERISLFFNRLIHLDAYTFIGLSNLKYLDLERNQLTNLSANTFKGLNNLWYLDMDNNNLTQLEAHILTDLDNLKYFFAKNNNISMIENGFIQRFNELCVNFLYFESNHCNLEHKFDNSCIRIEATSCDLFNYEKITLKRLKIWKDNEEELQILRYQVRSYKEISKNDISVIEDFKKELRDERQKNSALFQEVNNQRLERDKLKAQIITFNAKRSKDQEIIDRLVSERDDAAYLNGFLEDELRVFRNKDWEYQKTSLQNKVLKKEIESLTVEINLLKGNFSEVKTKSQMN